MSLSQEDKLIVNRCALGLMPRIPQSVYEQIIESDTDVEKLVSDPSVLNSLLNTCRCNPVGVTQFMTAVETAHQSCREARNHGVEVLTPYDDSYPQRLLTTPDYPRVLFKYGDCDLNCDLSLGIVGTRKCTVYGDSFVRKTLAELQPLVPGLLVVSGLAFGIDAAAHQGALQSGMPTVGVLAHGFGTIYPAQHRGLASEIRRNGGCLLTEYPWGVTPLARRFLERNRIVAGLSDHLLVAESPVKGGAMSTANIAFSIDRNVMALPGRISDYASGGCNMLIARHKAQLVTSAADISQAMGLLGNIPVPAPVLPMLIPELNGDEKRIYEFLASSREPVQTDVICASLNLPVARLTAILGEMEFDGVITRLAGNRFTIL